MRNIATWLVAQKRSMCVRRALEDEFLFYLLQVGGAVAEGGTEEEEVGGDEGFVKEALAQCGVAV